MAQNGGKRPGAGRPAGATNKVGADIKAIAQQYTTDAMDALVTIVRNVGSPESSRVAAANAILDRAYGKAPQAVTVDPGDEAKDWLATFLKAIDGKSRGLPAHRAPPNGSGVAPGQSLPHPGRNGTGH